MMCQHYKTTLYTSGHSSLPNLSLSEVYMKLDTIRTQEPSHTTTMELLHQPRQRGRAGGRDLLVITVNIYLGSDDVMFIHTTVYTKLSGAMHISHYYMYIRRKRLLLC